MPAVLPVPADELAPLVLPVLELLDPALPLLELVPLAHLRLSLQLHMIWPVPLVALRRQLLVVVPFEKGYPWL